MRRRSGNWARDNVEVTWFRLLAIAEFVREYKEKSLNILDDEVFALGALLGSQCVRGF